MIIAPRGSVDDLLGQTKGRVCDIEVQRLEGIPGLELDVVYNL